MKLVLQRTCPRIKLFLAALLLPILVVGCGGAGSKNSGCSDQKTLSISGSTYPEKTFQTRVGMPIGPFTPKLTGIPASCDASKYFSTDSGSPIKGIFDALPNGITLDRATGTISGIPTTPSREQVFGGVAVPVPSIVDVYLYLSGYEPLKIGTIEFLITK